MAIPVSTVPKTKAQLLADVVGQVNDTSVLVCYDAPPSQWLDNDLVVLGRVDRQVIVLAQVGDLGAGRFREQYTIEIEVTCWRGGNSDGSAETVEERAYTLVAAVETAVRNDPTMSGLVYELRLHDSVGVTVWEEDHSGFLATVTLPVEFLAVI